MLGFGIQGFRVQGLCFGLGVQGLGFRAWASGLGVSAFKGIQGLQKLRK